MTLAVKPFHFICAFWGDAYWREFCRICAASLLTPDNVPGLPEEVRAASRLVICTTAADWAAMQDHPTFLALSAYIAPHFIELQPPGEGERKMKVMSRGHRLASEGAFEAQALGVWLTPDLMLTNGTVARLLELSREQKAVVLCNAFRFSEEGCLPELEALGALEPGKPLGVTGRELTGIGLRHLHTETRQWEWEAPLFSQQPIVPYWTVRDRKGEVAGLVMHSFSWAPLLLDYSHIETHDTSTFEHWTLDGDYVDRNFGHLPDDTLYVVRDSDEIMLVSFTREADLHFATTPVWMCRVPWLNRRLRRGCLRWLYHSTVMDDLKRRIFERAVLVHDRDIDADLWSPRIRSAAEEVRISTQLPAERSENWVRSTFFRILWVRYSWRGIVATVKGTPMTPEAPLRWSTFKSGFLGPYGRLARNLVKDRSLATVRRLDWLVKNPRTVLAAVRRRLGLMPRRD